MNEQLQKLQVGNLPIIEIETEDIYNCDGCIFNSISTCEHFICRDRTPIKLGTHFEISPEYIEEQVKKYNKLNYYDK